jgi:hypothetical protein
VGRWRGVVMILFQRPCGECRSSSPGGVRICGEQCAARRPASSRRRRLPPLSNYRRGRQLDRGAPGPVGMRCLDVPQWRRIGSQHLCDSLTEAAPHEEGAYGGMACLRLQDEGLTAATWQRNPVRPSRPNWGAVIPISKAQPVSPMLLGELTCWNSLIQSWQPVARCSHGR